jgi:thiamine-phosphate pyrophosphorylase
LGVGSIYPTSTKPDAGSPIGIEGLRKIVSVVNIPVVAIGGINADNAKEVLAAGASGIAVISAVMAAPDIFEATMRLRKIVDEVRKR